jgi:hypothetical protein
MRPKIIRVQWTDAVSSQGWESMSKSYTPVNCHSAGFLIEETDKHITVAATWGEDDDGSESNNRITIPKAWIINRKVLR